MPGAKTDAQTRTDVLDRLWWDTAGTATDAGVEIPTGVATCTGTLEPDGKKLAAGEGAGREAGAVAAAADAQVILPTSAQRTDTGIEEAVRRGLTRLPEERSRSTPPWLPLASLLAALLFSVPAALILRARLEQPRAPQSRVAAPVAMGKVAEQDDGPVREYGVLSPRSGLMMPAVAPDGHVWVAEMATNRLAELDPATSTMREYAIPGSGLAMAMGTAVDAQGGVWFTEASRGAIAVYETVTGSFSEFSTGDTGSNPNGIAIDAAGNVWFTELAGAVGELDVHSGQMHRYPIANQGSAPYALAIDEQGEVWFSEFGKDKIGRLEPASGAVGEWAIPSPDGWPTGIAIAPDGSIWFSERDHSSIGRLSPSSGQIAEYPLAAGTWPSGLTVAPDGSVWVSDMAGSVLSEFDPASGTMDEFEVPTPDAGIFWFGLGPQGQLWADEANLGANKLIEIQRPLPR